jgi:hypothetical protein
MKHLITLFVSCVIWSVNLKCQDIKLHYLDVSLNYHSSIPIGFEIITKEGKHLKTKNFLGGKLPWRKLKIKVVGGQINRKGVLYTYGRPYVPGGCFVKFDVEYPKLKIRKQLELELLFNNAIWANYKEYTHEKPSEDPKLWKELLALIVAKKNGADGDFLNVNLDTAKINNKTILIVSITKIGSNRTARYYINPDLGNIHISSEGSDGDLSGQGGAGGAIEVYLKDYMIELLHCIYFESPGGKGGLGGDFIREGKAGPNGPEVYFINKP